MLNDKLWALWMLSEFALFVRQGLPYFEVMPFLFLSAR